MARIWDEQFEGAGTEESWNGGAVSGSAIRDPDYATSSVTGAPGDWGSQCLRISQASSEDGYYYNQFGSAEAVTYVRAELIVRSTNASGKFGNEILKATTASFGFTIWNVYLGDSGGADATLYCDFSTTGGTGNNVDINFDQRYRLEFYWNSTADEWEFRIDGSTIASGSLSGTAATSSLQILQVGAAGGGSFSTAEYIIDNVAIDDADWVGSEGLAAPGDFAVTGTQATQISVGWTDPNGGAANPRMYRRVNGTTPWTFVAELAASAESYDFTGLAPGETYDLGILYANDTG